ncbi:MAG TPA: ribosome maturation factor RimP [Hellea balneolensis]|uniref:Ribosome maturation factor RimP n=1 Tax=Hellea balneolensis TaxID=287478 RepID=A0A7C5R4I5_9PROT|nr:ribosome maturation factor RimP [Hellea balneolensis]
MKTKTSMDERILEIIDPLARDMGYNVVRLRLQGGKRATLQIMAERSEDGTMSVEDCARLSREISSTLEVEDPIDSAYVLEVSSPGLDRPLTALDDFKTYDGYLARIELDRLVEGRKRFRGHLAGVEDDQIAIDLDGEAETALIPFAWLSEAKLLITDEMIKKTSKLKKNPKNRKKPKNP